MVEAAAVRFCAAVAEKMLDIRLWDYGRELRPEGFGGDPAGLSGGLHRHLEQFRHLSKPSSVKPMRSRSTTKGLGYLDLLVTEGFPASTEHQKLLHHVCQDECKEIVNETLKNIYKMTSDIRSAVPSEETCTDRVVRQVEAEILGCCGRSCGWNGRTCPSIRCVLQNSSREQMCDSVLSPQQVHGSPSLTPPRKATSVVSTLDRTNKLKHKPKENEPVSSDFLEKNPDVHRILLFPEPSLLNPFLKDP